MESRGELRSDLGSLAAGRLEIVVLYTEPGITEVVLERAVALTAGLTATIRLVAVHTVPYPIAFGCPKAEHAFLVERLIELSSRCALPVSAQIVLARSRDEGFRQIVERGSIVLVGTRKHPWRTREEALARALVRDGYNVALVHVA